MFTVPHWGRNLREEWEDVALLRSMRNTSVIHVSVNFTIPLKRSIKYQQSNESWTLLARWIWCFLWTDILSDWKISCLQFLVKQVGFVLLKSAVPFLVFQHQSFAITKLLSLAVKPAQSQLADLFVFSRIRQKCVSFTWYSSLRLHQPRESWVH